MLLLKCCFTSTETVALLGTGAQDGHLDFHTAPELCYILSIDPLPYTHVPLAPAKVCTVVCRTDIVLTLTGVLVILTGLFCCVEEKTSLFESHFRQMKPINNGVDHHGINGWFPCW